VRLSRLCGTTVAGANAAIFVVLAKVVLVKWVLFWWDPHVLPKPRVVNPEECFPKSMDTGNTRWHLIDKIPLSVPVREYLLLPCGIKIWVNKPDRVKGSKRCFGQRHRHNHP